MCYLRQRPKIILKHFDSFSVPFGSLDTTAWSFKSVPPHSDPIKHCRKIDGGTNKESCGKTSWQVFSPIALPSLCSSLCVYYLSIYEYEMVWALVQFGAAVWVTVCTIMCVSANAQLCLRARALITCMMQFANSVPRMCPWVYVHTCVLLVCFCKTDQSRCVGVVLKKLLYKIRDQRVREKR